MKSMNRYLVTGLSNHTKDALSSAIGVEVIKHVPAGMVIHSVCNAEQLKYVFPAIRTCSVVDTTGNVVVDCGSPIDSPLVLQVLAVFEAAIITPTKFTTHSTYLPAIESVLKQHNIGVVAVSHVNPLSNTIETMFS